MTTRKSERLMNLFICLLVARHYVTKDRIREAVEGYAGSSDEAFEKMFERDKDDLRELGIPIEIGYLQKGFEDEPGYRIRRDQVALPDIRLEPDEAAVVGLAARLWEHASLAEATSSAVLKLRAGGVPVDAKALTVVQPHLGSHDAAFDPLWNAVLSRTAVSFDYRAPGRRRRRRNLQPWAVLSWHGHWYVLGHDTDRDEPRMFRMSRIDGAVETTGQPGSFEVPDDTDLRRLAAQLEPDTAGATATLRVRRGRAIALRRTAAGAEPAGTDGWDRLQVPFSGIDRLAESVVSYGADVVAEAPPELVTAVTDRLRRLAGVGQAEADG